jgi:hypothetical protein
MYSKTIYPLGAGNTPALISLTPEIMLAYPVCVDCKFFTVSRGCISGCSPDMASKALKKKKLSKRGRLA